MRSRIQYSYFLGLTGFFLLLLSCTSFHTRRFVEKHSHSSTPFVREHGWSSDQDLEREGKEKVLGYNDLMLANVPREMHYKIEQWLFWFQGDGQERMNTYLSRSSRYIPLMQDILAEYHLPRELVYVALIESGFSSHAVSRASAVGYWQFIRGTGRRYKLTINSYMDERRDAILSTHAAAKYFKGLYSVFGSWHLAMAAYNLGENRVKNQLLRHHTRDFWELTQKGNIPAETANYVPKFFAAMIIAKNPKKYGFKDVDYQPLMTFKEVKVPHSINLRQLAIKIGLDYQVLRQLNPKYLTSTAIGSPQKPLRLRIPKDIFGKKEARTRTRTGTELGVGAETEVEEVVVETEAEIEAQLKTYLAQAKVKTPRILRYHSYYRVRRGDTLSAIAYRFRVPMSRLKRVNRLRRSFIRIGQRLKIPYSYRASGKGTRSRNSSSKKGSLRNNSEKVHIVRKGDTLSTIARRYRVSLNAIVRRNQLRNYSKIFTGSRLIIPQ